jgi:hypothetical protein
MNRLAGAALTVIVVVLSGCATAPRSAWYRYTGTLQDAKKDVADCRYEVVKYGPQNVINTGLGSGVNKITGDNYVMAQCMTHRGYRFADPATAVPLKDKISMAGSPAKTKAQLVELLGPIEDRNGAPASSFVVIQPMDTGPLGMDWYPQSRMNARYQEAFFSFSPDGIIEKVMFREANEIFLVR